ncbi:hypothetical protein M9458_053991 [Cirrhinus mrigala]|uniref:Uncharacterized protein n=1 Tax=Cirrhinus mrigala TaxID=683832 RepID=A0ABD0MPI7_CIRMR
MAEATSVRYSPNRSAPGSSGQSAPGRIQSSLSSPILAGPSVVLGPDFSPRRLSMGDSRQEGSPLTGLIHSTLKVYVATISAYHTPLGGMPPFEPIEEILNRFLTIKTALLLALTSLKRVGDLQALSVAPSHLDFAPGMAKAFLYPRAGYVPKVPTTTPQPVMLQAFCPPPFREPDQQKRNCMCPVRVLDIYVHRAALEPSFRHPSNRSLHSPKLTPAPPHVLLCFLVAYVTRPLHTSYSVFGCSISFPRGTRVTYVTWDVFS